MRYILLNTNFISFNIDEGVNDVTVILKGRIGRDFYLDFPVL